MQTHWMSSLSEESIPLRPRPLQEAGIEEPQITSVEENKSQDATGKFEKPGSGLQFVAETGRARPKGAVLRLIRSQARRQRVKRHQDSLSKRMPPLLRPNIKLESNKGTSNRTFPGLLVQLSLKDTSPGRELDPFDTLPIGHRGNSYYLMSHYDIIFDYSNSRYSPVRPAFRKEEFLKFAMSDSAVLHMTLAQVAKTLCSLAKMKSSPELIYHLGRAIALVNQRIANCNHEAVTKETIYAVAFLTHVELRSDSMPSLQIHLDGLEALIKSIGGIQNLASHPLTLRFTYWVGILCSIAMDSKPRFELVDPAHYPGPEDLEPCSLLGMRYQTKLYNLTGSEDLSKEMIEVYCVLRHLIEGKEKAAGKKKMRITETEFESLRSYTDQLMPRLIVLTQHKFPQQLNQNAEIYSLFGNSGLAHIVIFTRNVPPLVGIPRLMSTRIRRSIEMINLLSFQIAYPEMMLWIIMMGGLASIGTKDQGWFVELLAESCRAAGISGTGELAIFLAEFLWSDFYLGPIFKEFWEDVAVAQATEAGNDIGDGE